MSHHDHALEFQQLALNQIETYKDKIVAAAALRFADRLGQMIAHYNPVADTIQLYDGEVYTLRQAILAEAAWQQLKFGTGAAE